MADDREFEDLEALLKAPGWLRYRNAIKAEWEGRFDSYVTAAVSGNKDALTELMKLTAARTAVLASLTYPESRLQQLTQAAKARTLESSLSRRGPL